jgi:hypothetical protein
VHKSAKVCGAAKHVSALAVPVDGVEQRQLAFCAQAWRLIVCGFPYSALCAWLADPRRSQNEGGIK